MKKKDSPERDIHHDYFLCNQRVIEAMKTKAFRNQN